MPATRRAIAAFSTRIGLPDSDRHPLIEPLHERLADTAGLHSPVKQAHSNVKGPALFQLHRLFDQLAAELSMWPKGNGT